MSDTVSGSLIFIPNYRNSIGYNDAIKHCPVSLVRNISCPGQFHQFDQIIFRETSANVVVAEAIVFTMFRVVTIHSYI